MQQVGIAPTDSTPAVAPGQRMLFLVDPLDSLLAHHDTSVALMEAAQQRRHAVWVATGRDLEAERGTAIVAAQRIDITPARLEDGRWHPARPWYRVTETRRRPVDDFDVVFVRTDPPVEANYLRATFLLDLVDPKRTRILNSPRGLREANEKLFALREPGLGPQSFVSANLDRIVERVQEWGKAVLKPTDAMAGRGIVILTPDDPNLRSLIEMSTLRGAQHVVVQRWVPNAEMGDRRVIVLDGEPIGVVRRVAGEGEFRHNMASGAAAVADEVSARDREICDILRPHLRELGLGFVGLDVIAGQLTEVNVTSPTGLREIQALTGADIAGEVIEWAAANAPASIQGAVK